MSDGGMERRFRIPLPTRRNDFSSSSLPNSTQVRAPPLSNTVMRISPPLAMTSKVWFESALSVCTAEVAIQHLKRMHEHLKRSHDRDKKK